jgi:hypothetical protein
LTTGTRNIINIVAWDPISNSQTPQYPSAPCIRGRRDKSTISQHARKRYYRRRRSVVKSATCRHATWIRDDAILQPRYSSEDLANYFICANESPTTLLEIQVVEMRTTQLSTENVTTLVFEPRKLTSLNPVVQKSNATIQARRTATIFS